MLNVYSEFAEKYMAVPVVKGVKSANERFAGALNTYTTVSYTHLDVYKRQLWLCNPNNPTGTVADKEYMRGLIEHNPQV